MAQGWEPMQPKRSSGNELGDHFKAGQSRDQAERSRRANMGRTKKPSLWKRLFRKT